MADNRDVEQGDILAAMLRGQATQSEVARLEANLERWLRQDWHGRSALATAACVGALATAYGGMDGEWGTLTDEEHGALVWFFGILYLPTEDSARDDAYTFRSMFGSGTTLRFYAQKIMRHRQPPR